jgi:hypothetical protein
MKNYWFIGLILALMLLLSLSLAACIQSAAAPPTQALKPDDKIGAMVVTKGPIPFDLKIPPIAAFCNTNPFIEAGATVATPGEYTVECAMPPLPQLAVGFGWVAINAERRDIEWAAVTSELYINDQPVDQSAFGSLDADVPVTGAPGLEANKVVTQSLRFMNVILANLQPGPMVLRWIFHVNEKLYDGLVTVPAGTYDTTFKIIVDKALAGKQGTPEPVVLIQQTAEIFDAFNTAVNAHDVDKALSFFADDATVQFPNQPPPNVFKGATEIRNWLENDAKDNIHVEIENTKTSGDTVSATAKVDVDSLPPDLILVGTVEATVKNGKITAFSYTLNDETLAKLQASAPPRLEELIGSWHAETTVLKQGATFPALLTFTGDGIVIADEPPSPFETSGHGNWVVTSPQAASFTFLALIGSKEGPLSATIKVVGTLQYDANTDTWNGPFKVQVVDADGKEVLADTGTFKATRIAIEKID